MRAHADQLEQQASDARLVAMAGTPLDGIAVAWDIAMSRTHKQATREARERGEAPPSPSPPVSKLLTDFADGLREKIAGVGGRLQDDERERLAAIAPQVLACIEADDKPVVETLARLISLSPEWIALWLRGHLHEIETRFAP
nr:hypothetical protein [Kofleriaceae bacterium]